MILSQKNAVIYGAAGSLGEAVSRAFATAGAKVFLTGRNLPALESIAASIISNGGQAEVARVDALNSDGITQHLEAVKQAAGSVDITFNAVGLKDTQDQPLIEMALDDFIRPVNIAMQTHFLTATAAGRVMVEQGSGVILSLTATPGGVAYPMVGGFGPACSAIESFAGSLASEVGPYGVRVVNIRSAGSPDSRVFREAIAAGGPEMEKAIERLAGDTMLKKMPLMKDIANTAVFLASDLAASITGVTIDVTAGSTTGLNHTTEKVKFLE